MEAMACGVPAILPPQFEETFGSAATCAEPADVPLVVAELWQSEQSYLERARAGRDFVLRNCDISDFQARVNALKTTVEKDSHVDSAPTGLITELMENQP
jgi:hypothetical protein